MGTQQAITGAMLTNVGAVRSLNEDSVVFVIPPANTASSAVGVLCLVADGMGGHAAGGIASQIAAEVIREYVYSAQHPPLDLLSKAFMKAHEAILNYTEQFPETSGMGTTCTAILFHEGFLHLAHVGDSRAYLIRHGEISQITEDQTFVADMVRSRKLTIEEASVHPQRHLILQALGASATLSPATRKLALFEGDQVILCSDGLYSDLSNQEIANACLSNLPHEACEKLQNEALVRGGKDNISIGVFRVGLPNNVNVGKNTRSQISALPVSDA